MGFLRNHTASTLVAYVLIPVLVGLTTWLVLLIQHALPVSPGTSVRPYSICYLIPIAIIAVIGGRVPGFLSLLLSLICLDTFLIEHHHNFVLIQHDIAGALLLLLTGSMIIISIDALRNQASYRHQAEDSAARLQSIMDTTPIGILVTDLAGIVRYANPEAEYMLGRSPVSYRLDVVENGMTLPLRPSGDAASRSAGQKPDTILTACLPKYAGVEQREWAFQRDGAAVIIEARATAIRDKSGNARSGLVVLLDISERRRSERQMQARANREALINRIGDAIRGSLDPEEIQYAAVAALGEALKVDRCYFMTYDYAADYAWAGKDWRRNDLASVAGQYRTSDLKLHPAKLYRPGKTLVVDDVRSGLFQDVLVGDFARAKVRSLIGVPMYEDGQLAASLVVAMADEARIWTPDEILLTEAVAAQTRSAVAVARMLIQERGRRRTEEVSNRIAETLRQSIDPEIIRARALSVVGKALDADYCFSMLIDDNPESFTIKDDWHKQGLPTIAGSHSFAEYRLDLASLFQGGPTLVVDSPDQQPWSSSVAPAMARLGLTSMIAVPVYEAESLQRLLVVAMHESARHWSGDEVRLMERAAAQTRLTLDAARVRLREHTVAEALQRALMPEPPNTKPIFDLHYFYQAALDESSVGGDFYDVFEVGSGSYAIVIGDVSGKGLAAAAQIASVRNMLRYAAVHDAHLASGIAKLNYSLSGDSQLTGFATLFVGIFDSSKSTLTYVSCGHEPALVRRAGSDRIDELNSTGPPLGAFAESEFEQEVVPLMPGDTMLLYTDGISEAGVSRANMLGSNGLIDMLRDEPPTETARELVEHLITRVKEFSNNVLRDDVCIVAAVIGKPS